MNVLAASQHYRVYHDFEVTMLERQREQDVCVGDFYGDPVAAVIDKRERWCVTVGCGLIVYFIRPPFLGYSYSSAPGDQWFEMFREPDDVWWIDTVEQTEDDMLHFTVRPCDRHAGAYGLHVPSRRVTKLG